MLTRHRHRKSRKHSRKHSRKQSRTFKRKSRVLKKNSKKRRVMRGGCMGGFCTRYYMKNDPDLAKSCLESCITNMEDRDVIYAAKKLEEKGMDIPKNAIERIEKARAAEEERMAEKKRMGTEPTSVAVARYTEIPEEEKERILKNLHESESYRYSID